MATKDNLQKKYAKLDTVDLLQIMGNKDNYTNLARSIADEDLKTRKVPSEDFRNYKSERFLLCGQ